MLRLRMAMTIPVLWPLLVLLCIPMVAWSFSINNSSSTVARAIVASSPVKRFPGTYTGGTPYNGIPIGSANVTVPLITQRDVALNVTLDHLLWPTIGLSTSYFNTDYSSEKIARVGEVMAMGYRRLVVDLYWDMARRHWQLCPVPVEGNAASSLYTCTHPSSSSSPFRELLKAVDEQLLATNLTASPAQTNLYILILNLQPLTNIAAGNAVAVVDAAAAAEATLKDMLMDVIGRHRLYTPQDLDEFRQNSSAYPWPTWISLIKDEIQLLVGLGKNDVSASEYKFTDDLDTIFDVGQLLNTQNMTKNFTSALTAPCTYTNVSWATMNDSQNDRFNYSTTLKAVECGYSPYFTASNYSTSNAVQTADDPKYLEDNILGTIWSWDVGEPRYMVRPHCAMVQRWNGRWRSGDCTQLLRVACRHQDDPNEWIVTSTFVSYDRAFASCPLDYVFDCPRIAVQNQRLYEVLQEDLIENGKDDPASGEELHNLFWINLNAGSSGFCWVVGLFSTCWWFMDPGAAFASLIKTSAVAGVIILILVGIFTWVKCARSWRDRNARSRKNMIKELLVRREYVTVPA